MAESCPEHEEKLKLFCVTDQQLACIICRDGEKHEGHKFKPVKEAAASLRKELETFGQRVADDISAVESLGNTQKQEIAKTKKKSQQLTTQISSQFEEMHQFLRKREGEIKIELKHTEEEEMKKMRRNLKALEAVLSEDKALDKKVKSLLETSDPELFLKNWSEESSVKSAKSSFQPRGSNLKVLNTSLCLGPYESHLQFFVWKEMLQMIQPREERLTLKTHSPNVAVSADGQRLFSKPKSQQVSAFGNAVPPSTGSPVQSGGLFGNLASTGSTVQSGGFCFGASQSGFSFGNLASTGSTVQSGGLFGASQSGFSFGSPTSTGSKSQSGRRFGSSKMVQTLGVSHPQSGFVGYDGSGTSQMVYSVGNTTSSSLDSPVNPGVPVTNHALSVAEFTSGQHYWEMDARSRDFWEVGITDHYLQYDGQRYATCGASMTTELAIEKHPGNIGIYLNCSSGTLSFYDADRMTRIDTVSSVSMPVSAYVKIKLQEPDYSPVTVRWY